MKFNKLSNAEDTHYKEIRTIATHNVNFITSALFSFRPVSAPGCGGIVPASHGRLLVDLAHMDEQEWTREEQAAELIWAVFIILRNAKDRHEYYRHIDSNTRIDFKSWMVVVDMEISDDFSGMGLSLRDGHNYPVEFGMKSNDSAEHYMDKLLDGAEEMPQSPISDEALDMMDSEDLDSIEDPMTDIEAKTVENNVAREVEEEVKKGRGTVPSSVKRWASEVLQPPKVDWRAQFRSAVRSRITDWKGRRAYSFRKVSRRASNMDVAPGRIGFTPQVVVAIDTSGSMGTNDLNLAVSEVAGVVSATKGKLGLFAVDASVKDMQKVSSVSQIDLTGGGGTDMRLAFDQADQLKERPHIFVLITDGFTPWPETPPKAMDCIILLTTGLSRDNVPAWAKTIVIE